MVLCVYSNGHISKRIVKLYTPTDIRFMQSWANELLSIVKNVCSPVSSSTLAAGCCKLSKASVSYVL